MTIALVNGRVLTDNGFQGGFAVLVDDGTISGLALPSDPRVRAAQRHDLGGRTLLPGFIDCQVNGGGGVLFNDAPTVDTIRRIGEAHARFGTTGFLPTLISDDA
ncbi:MAG: N-acetylglucosamine-6-phosphate deacetylase, partial [Luteibacter jiangsuensis]